MAVALVAMAGLAALFRFTGIGLQMRAVVESPRMTELNGIRADRVSAFAWALSSFFAGLAGVLIAPRFNTLAAPDFFNLVVVAIAAAAVGRLVSLPWALVGGLGLGVLIALAEHVPAPLVGRPPALRHDPGERHPGDAVRRALRAARPVAGRAPHACEQSDPLSGVDPPPPSLAALDRSQWLTRATQVFAVVFLAVVGFVVFTQADASWLFLVTQAVILATIFLSITVITGMAGQISLCQGTFAAIGAFSRVPADGSSGHAGAAGAGSSARCWRPRSPPSCRCPCSASEGCGWPSPRWPSPSSSTP